MLSITPKAFNAVQVVAPLRATSLLSDNYMIAAHAQRSISVPIVRVIKTAWLGVLSDESFNDLARTPSDGKHSDHTVALKNAEHNHFTCCTPATFTRAFAAKHRLIALDSTFKRRGAIFSQAHHLTNQVKELFGGGTRRWAAKAQSVGRHTEHEVIEQPKLGTFTQPCALPHTVKGVGRAALSTLKPTVRKHPRPMMSTSWTYSSHRARILAKSGTV